MGMNYISDQDIDKILGRIGDFNPGPTHRSKLKKQTADNQANNTVNKNTPELDPVRARQRQYPKKRTDVAGQPMPDVSHTSHTPAHTFSYLLDQETRNSLNTFGDKFSVSEVLSAGIIRKVYAFFTDLSIVSILLMGFIYGSVLAFGKDSFVYSKLAMFDRISFLGVPDVVIWLAGLYVVLLFFYFIYFEALLGQTLGKMFLNIKLIDESREKPPVFPLVLRVFFFFIPLLGLLGLHNRFTGIKVVKN